MSSSPDQVQQAVIDSGLRGRGGAGFPTGKKWSFVPRDLPGPRWLICNCDEMEPGTYKDRVLLEANPYSLLEGIVLASLCHRGASRLYLHPARLRAGRRQPAPGHRRVPRGRPGRREYPRQRLFLRHRCACLGRALHLRRRDRPDERPGGQTGQPAVKTAISRPSRDSGAVRRWSTMPRVWPTSPALSATDRSGSRSWRARRRRPG